MADCPVCGSPGAAPNDEALYLRYRSMTPEEKRAFRAMAKELMKADKAREEQGDE